MDRRVAGCPFCPPERLESELNGKKWRLNLCEHTDHTPSRPLYWLRRLRDRRTLCCLVTESSANVFAHAHVAVERTAHIRVDRIVFEYTGNDALMGTIVILRCCCDCDCVHNGAPLPTHRLQKVAHDYIAATVDIRDGNPQYRPRQRRQHGCHKLVAGSQVDNMVRCHALPSPQSCQACSAAASMFSVGDTGTSTSVSCVPTCAATKTAAFAAATRWHVSVPLRTG